MKNLICSLLSLSTLALLLGVGVSLSAQQDAPRPGQPPQAQQQPGSQPDSGSQPSGSNAQSQTGTAQTFSGTVMKSGDKFVLQDTSGTSYDVDKQDAVKPFEGKKVTIHGTLDPNGKLIHVQQ